MSTVVSTLTSATLESRFRARTRRTADGCFEWTGGRYPDGYGKFPAAFSRLAAVTDRNARAHHVGWYVKHGEWPTLCLLHRCDNPLCCDDSHLFEGTRAENAADRESKGRTTRGADCRQTHLTEDDVRDIRRRRAAGERLEDIGAMFGIHRGTVWAIEKRLNWKHV
jgi:HNH endonuclease